MFIVESLCMSKCMPLIIFVAYITSRPLLVVRYGETKIQNTVDCLSILGTKHEQFSWIGHNFCEDF